MFAASVGGRGMKLGVKTRSVAGTEHADACPPLTAALLRYGRDPLSLAERRMLDGEGVTPVKIELQLGWATVSSWLEGRE